MWFCTEAAIARGTLLQADVGEHNTGSKRWIQFGQVLQHLSLRWRVGWSISQVGIVSTGFPPRLMIQVIQVYQ